jgi:hypothetical protein
MADAIVSRPAMVSGRNEPRLVPKGMSTTPAAGSRPMNGVFPEIFALGITIALSPMTIIAAILMLLTPHGRWVGVAFLVGWIAGLVIVEVVLLQLTGPAGVREKETAEWVDTARLLVGVALILVAVLNWRRRAPQSTPPLPAWTRMIDRLNPFLALGLGAAWAGPSPKNLVLLSAAAVSITEASLPSAQEVAAIACLAIAASLGVAVPVVWALFSGEAALKHLTHWRQWLIAYNATIMAVVLGVAGVLLIGKSIASLAG